MIDFAYLAAQTFGDVDLQMELLALFLQQGRQIIPTLPHRDARGQADTAHLLKGSARAVGAHAVAAATETYEQAHAHRRQADDAPFAALQAAFLATEAAVTARFPGVIGPG